jgi:hypothetical protein
MTSTIRIRLSGDPDAITDLVATLATRFEVAGGDRAYPNRGAFGVRVYLEARPRTTTPDLTPHDGGRRTTRARKEPPR